MKTIKIISIAIFALLISCKSKTNNEPEAITGEEGNAPTTLVNLESSGCGFEDGTYSATVDYSNSETDYAATYTLDVEVEDCQIVKINFPNGGYLDEDHISYADIDEDGNATVEGEDGKTYEVSIDN